jgi:hypothetical protein
MTMRKYINLFEDTSGVTEDWFSQGAFKTFKKPNPEQYEIAEQDGVIQTLEGPVTYQSGDYIMTGPKGEKYPISPTTFRELKDDAGNGVCYPKKIIKLAKLADHDGELILKYNGSKLNYNAGEDYIVRHGAGDYGAVKKDIFAKTYEQVK